MLIGTHWLGWKLLIDTQVYISTTEAYSEAPTAVTDFKRHTDIVVQPTCEKFKMKVFQ